MLNQTGYLYGKDKKIKKWFLEMASELKTVHKYNPYQHCKILQVLLAILQECVSYLTHNRRMSADKHRAD